MQSTIGKLHVCKVLAGNVPEGKVPYVQTTGRQSTYRQITMCKVQLANYSWAKYITVKVPVGYVLAGKVRPAKQEACKILHWQVDWRATYQRPGKLDDGSLISL